ncbi:dihydroneopterin triphosphate pyrophosphatase [Sulfurifustis variabilis]|uniref:Dihydroneopterin triphosphate pyrophosphatase n=1 Tax=Sulfurifustis variabilis TaxID=1675686 RepID=A0A1C7AF51_9GAMM|nr:dihydroneopterin triphosphate diphosphatase [Sulfurifustis variabilis]BAU49870.1 dihydroneopterin triphosphate pyrophosphatase [Sulfurifustis variabilis]
MPPAATNFRRPESVLVVVHTAHRVLLLRRADAAGFWQSVTGSLEWNEDNPRQAAVRELREETGLAVLPEALTDLALTQRYTIMPQWRARYAPGVTENTEYGFAVAVDSEIPVVLSPEHAEFAWFEFPRAAATVYSWSNRAAIEAIARNLG